METMLISRTYRGNAWQSSVQPDHDYEYAHDSAGEGVDNTYFRVQWRYEWTGFGSYYYWEIHRAFAHFDTSPLEGYIILSARLLMGWYSMGWEDSYDYATVHVVQSSHNIPLQASDYGAVHDNIVSGGYITRDDYLTNPNASHWLNLNDTGISWINKSGMTKFCYRVYGDILGDENSTEPTGTNWIDLCSNVIHKLEVTYVESPGLTRVTSIKHYYYRTNADFLAEVNLGGVMVGTDTPTSLVTKTGEETEVGYVVSPESEAEVPPVSSAVLVGTSALLTGVSTITKIYTPYSDEFGKTRSSGFLYE